MIQGAAVNGEERLSRVRIWAERSRRADRVTRLPGGKAALRVVGERGLPADGQLWAPG